MHLRLLSAALALTLATAALAQALIARDKASATIDGKAITIEYGRPALNGRSFDDLIKKLPGDRIWRAGSGPVTVLSTEADLTIGGKKIAAGKYSLYVHCPEQGDYSLVINRDLGQPLSKIFPGAPPSQANDPYPHFDYTKEIGNQEVARVPMKKVSGPANDVFTISVKPAKSGAVMNMSWDDRNWTLDITAAK